MQGEAQKIPRGLREATTSLLPRREALALLPPPSDGRTRWTSLLLAPCAILMSWDGGPALKDRFESARRCLLRWYPGRRRPGGSYQGFVGRPAPPRPPAGPADRGPLPHARAAAGRGRGALAGGGVADVRGRRHQARRADDGGQRGAARLCQPGRLLAAQMVLTCVFHVGSGLPWSFLRGHARSSERRHLCGLLATLPPDALLLADAGFTGYDLWRRIVGSGRSFLVRVGGNVRLIEGLAGVVRVRTCADGGIVWVWPADRQAERQRPLVLRLVTLTDGRNRVMYLLTDVTDPSRLPDATAARLYAMRWGVEVTFRSLKQTLGRRKLLSDAPRNARAELSWAMIGLWTLLLIKARRCCPTHLAGGRGVAAVLRVLRRAIVNACADVRHALSRLRPDAYRRSRPKTARHWPHRKRPKPPGRPRARNATETELALAKELGVPGVAA